ncbi:hypothetical protein NEF87_001501 [Candidatus Lokiarchaeum ossiferum]|uniref:Uncharacterized protein n=1 Tax=Candidatus Lokiarchaeum ossiferum TaxID=2951803 RepID=A0ABY6HP62_9ARCH|nr:hypothetical protein NEF87_001501 [Candidatus Lokiarchaeum sp. B-35]
MIPDKFLKVLLETVLEQFSTIKTQLFRLQSILNTNWPNFNPSLLKIKNMKVDPTDFLENLSYRIQVLQTLHQAMNDTLIVIKTLIDNFYEHYLFPEQMRVDFPESDFFSVVFLTNEILIGSLLQYFMLDLTNVPMGYIVVAKNKELMKIKPLSAERIRRNMNRSNFDVSIDEIHSILSILIAHNYVEQCGGSDSPEMLYRFIKDFTLSGNSEVIFNKKIRNLIEWIIGIWRSLYNLRSLDMPIPENYACCEFLEETVSRAATQGYLNASNVIENIIGYYQMLENEKL